MKLSEELRLSILQSALQGKIVEHDLREGTGKELYEQLQSEKQSLIKAGKIKKEKKLAKITEEEIPFDIPKSWTWVRWGTIAESIQYGYNAPALKAGRIKMVRISDIQNNEVLWDTVPYCNINESEIDRYLLKKNDILFARTGGTVGKSFLVKNVPVEAIYAGYLIRTRYSASLCPEYLKYFMESKLYWDQLRNGTVATAQPNCNGKTLSKMILPLPPIAEQYRIVEKVEQLMIEIGKLEEKENKLEKLKKKFPEDMKASLLQAATEGKLTKQLASDSNDNNLFEKISAVKDTEFPFVIPDTWKWIRLKDIVEIINGDRGKNYPSKNKLSNQGYAPFVSAVNINNGKVSNDGLLFLSKDQYEKLSRGQLHKGDLILCIRGSLGKCGFFQYDLGAIASSLVIIRPCEKELIDLNYIFNYINSPIFYSELKKYNNGTAQPNLGARDLKKFLVPLPPLEEQKRIVAKLDELLPLCEGLKES